MSSSDSDESSVCAESTMLFLVTALENHPELLEKSQLPEAKRKKEEAILNVIHSFETNIGIKIDRKQLLKKVSNMKMRLKRKTDKNRTGNKPIVLNVWEKKLYSLLQGDGNPTMNQIPGKI